MPFSPFVFSVVSGEMAPRAFSSVSTFFSVSFVLSVSVSEPSKPYGRPPPPSA